MVGRMGSGRVWECLGPVGLRVWDVRFGRGGAGIGLGWGLEMVGTLGLESIGQDLETFGVRELWHCWGRLGKRRLWFDCIGELKMVTCGIFVVQSKLELPIFKCNYFIVNFVLLGNQK